jgi:multidrug efflux pump subunit AcrB
VLACAALPLLGMALVPTLDNEFFPSADRNQFQIQLTLRDDASIDAAMESMAAVERYVTAQDDVTQFFWCAGTNAPSVYYNMVMDEDDNPAFAQAVVTTRDLAAARELAARLQRELDTVVPNALVVPRLFAQGPPTAAPIEVRLSGPGLETLRTLGETVRRVLSQTPGVLQAEATLAPGSPKALLPVDEDEARLAGLTLAQTAGQLQANLVGVRGGSVLEQVESLPVRVRLGDDERRLDASLDGQLVLPGMDGAGPWTPIAALAGGALGGSLVPEAPAIPHFDGERTNTVEAFVDVQTLPLEVQADFLERLAASGFSLPPGYTLSLGGEDEQQGEAMTNLFRFVPLLAMLMVSALILAFRSLRMAALLGMVAGLSVGAGLLAVKAAGFPLGFMAILGVSGLIGIALNDAIVVVASLRHADIRSRAEMDRIPGIVMSNARHVIATTLTTMGGFLPLLLGSGTLWPPLATVIAYGVAGATVLSLLFTPACFVLLLPKEPRRGRTAEMA